MAESKLSIIDHGPLGAMTVGSTVVRALPGVPRGIIAPCLETIASLDRVLALRDRRILKDASRSGAGHGAGNYPHRGYPRSGSGVYTIPRYSRSSLTKVDYLNR